MKIATPKQSGPVIAVLFALAAAGTLAATTWFAIEQSRLYGEVRDQLGAIEVQALRVDSLESRWQSVSDEAELIERAFVRRDQLAVFLETIEATAANAGVFEETSIFEEEPDEITLRLRVSGPFKSVYTFVTHLNVLPNLLFLERAEFFRGALVAPNDLTADQVKGFSSAEVIVRVPLKITVD